MSWRDAVTVLARLTGQPIGIATLNRRVNQRASVAAAFHWGPWEWVPPVVMLDGIWLKVLGPTGDEDVDTRGRQRQRQKRRMFPVLMAYGVDPVSGERWVLDGVQGAGEDQASGQKPWERLRERGRQLIVH